VRGVQSCLHFTEQTNPLTKWNNVTIKFSYGRAFTDISDGIAENEMTQSFHREGHCQRM
jgi:hypothetical protein